MMRNALEASAQEAAEYQAQVADSLRTLKNETQMALMIEDSLKYQQNEQELHDACAESAAMTHVDEGLEEKWPGMGELDNKNVSDCVDQTHRTDIIAGYKDDEREDNDEALVDVAAHSVLGRLGDEKVSKSKDLMAERAALRRRKFAAVRAHDLLINDEDDTTRKYLIRRVRDHFRYLPLQLCTENYLFEKDTLFRELVVNSEPCLYDANDGEGNDEYEQALMNCSENKTLSASTRSRACLLLADVLQTNNKHDEATAQCQRARDLLSVDDDYFDESDVICQWRMAWALNRKLDGSGAKKVFNEILETEHEMDSKYRHVHPLFLVRAGINEKQRDNVKNRRWADAERDQARKMRMALTNYQEHINRTAKHTDNNLACEAWKLEADAAKRFLWDNYKRDKTDVKTIESALGEIPDMLSRNSSNPHIFEMKAKLLEVLGNYDGALRALDQALEIHRDNDHLLTMQSSLRFRAKNSNITGSIMFFNQNEKGGYGKIRCKDGRKVLVYGDDVVDGAIPKKKDRVIFDVVLYRNGEPRAKSVRLQ